MILGESRYLNRSGHLSGTGRAVYLIEVSFNLGLADRCISHLHDLCICHSLAERNSQSQSFARFLNVSSKFDLELYSKFPGVIKALAGCSRFLKVFRGECGRDMPVGSRCL